MDLQLADRPCLVTGASTGIGTGIARVLAAEGARLALTARRGDLLDALADDIAAGGVARPLTVAADLTDADTPAILVAAVEDAFGGLDVLINNAGASHPTPVDAADEVWAASLELNFTAVRRLTQAFLPGMRARRWGRILNVTGTMEPFGVNAATAAKAAVQAWAKGLSRDLGGEGITVNCIIPGRIMSEQVVERIHPDADERQRFAEAHIPVGYFGEPEDVGHLMAFLASPLARLITGSVLYVDGGMKRFSH
jgi:3-oxoacyl-[acyl-carrier protein] reductase